MYDYLKREYPVEVDFAANTFRHYLNKNYEGKFEKRKSLIATRFETLPGEQAQFNFKEDFKIDSISGERLQVQISILQFTHLRFLFRSIIPDKSTESVIQFMIDCFETIGKYQNKQ